MANIQAVGTDGLTIVYLAASGTGEADDPFVSRYDINGLDSLATEASLLDAINKIPTFAYDASRLLVKTELAQPLTDNQLRAEPIEVLLESTAITNTTFAATQSGAWTVSVDNQTALTDAELRAAPVAVTGNFYPATQPISAAFLPLPTGATTAANQTTLIGHVDGIGSALAGTISVNTHLDQPLTNTELRATAVPVSVSNFPASQPVTVSSLPLPTGAASESTLSALNAKIPSLSSGRIPVDIGALSLGSSTEITNDTSNPIPVSGSITVGNFPTTQVISGTVNTGLNQPLTDTQLREAPVAVTGTFWQSTQPVSLSSLPPLASGSNTIGAISNTSFGVSNFPSSFAATQSGTWSVGINNFPETQTIAAVSLPLPTGAATSAKQDTLIGHVDGIEAALAGTIAVNTGLSQPLTNTELRASPINVFSSLPRVTSVTTLSLTTNAIGTLYTSFSDHSCNVLEVINNSGVTVEYQRGGSGVAIPIPSGGSRLILGITNANQISIRRTDTTNTQVTVQAEAFTL